jgi:hypothetical protein
MTNLADLLAYATVSPNTLVKKEVEYKLPHPETKEETTYTADIFVVKEVSFAASDRINLGDRNAQDASRHARLISERVRLGENGEERLSAEQASRLHPSVGWAFLTAVLDVDKGTEEVKS